MTGGPRPSAKTWDVEGGYDAAGNVLNDGPNQYLYDGDGRICAVANTPVPGMKVMTGYIYDAGGTRVAKGSIAAWSCDPTISGFKTTNDYVLGTSGQQVTEMGMDSNNTMAWQHTNVFAAGTLIATYDGGTATGGGSTGGLHFYLNDPLGTRRAQTDYAGVVEQTCASLPFGDGLACSNSTQYPTEHHFTGKERDAESGNDYFGARYYSSAMGRFMSPDWSAKEEPVPYAKMDDPQSLNLYAYVRNNPLDSADPDGHACSVLIGNAGSGFCKRASEYARFDAISAVRSQTRFFAAASAVSEELADVAVPVLSRAFVSGQTATFLENVGQDLEKMNVKEEAAIQNGSLSGPGLDARMVHTEQTEVQSQLDNLHQSHPVAYAKIILEINGVLNPGKLAGIAGNIAPTDRAYARVLDGVQKSLGHNVDFSNQGDREALGNALIKQAGGPSTGYDTGGHRIW
jgi:RHS repeat-associated protein